MAQKLKLGVDVDGVLMDFTSAFREEAEALLGRELPAFSVDWDFSNWGMRKNEYKALWQRVMSTEDWFLNEKPLPRTKQILPLLDKDFELCFITTRAATAGLSIRHQTQLQLFQCGVDFPTVIVTSDKGPFAALLGLDAFIDDKPENLERIHECSPSTKLFLMDQTWNADYKEPDWITRVYSLDTFYAKMIEQVLETSSH